MRKCQTKNHYQIPYTLPNDNKHKFNIFLSTNFNFNSNILYNSHFSIHFFSKFFLDNSTLFNPLSNPLFNPLFNPYAMGNLKKKIFLNNK